MNQEGFHRRMNVVEGIITSLGLKHLEIHPVDYDEGYHHPYNNFIYKVTLSSPATAGSFPRQPCTVSPPIEGVDTLIVRLSNPKGTGLNDTNRVENEVAAMFLTRAALAHLRPQSDGLVPGVYAWKAAAGPDPADEAGFGWTVMQYMTGVPLDAPFREFDLEAKKKVIDETAAIFAAFQKVKLPDGVKSYGGLTIDTEGNVVSGQATFQSVAGGPWRTYEEYWRASIERQLKSADAIEVIGGWQANGVRSRIDELLNNKLGGVLKDGGADASLLALVHVDFTLNNMLYDKDTGRITAFLDFDWAGVTHPAHEFFTSFHDVNGNAVYQRSEKLRQAIQTGNFAAVDAMEDGDDKKEWELAKAWDDAVRRHGGSRPSDFPDIQTLIKLRTFLSALCPYNLRKVTDETAAARVKSEEKLVSMLEEWGV